MDGGMRQRLLALVRARLERFGVDHNPATVLDPEAAAELTALLETVPDPVADLEIAYTAGMLHWSRYLVLDSDDDQQDFAAALTLLGPVYRVRPDAVPDEVRTHFGRLAAANDPQAVADRAASLLEETLSTGNRSDLDAAINACRQAVAATPAGHPAHAQSLSTLGFALTTRFWWRGNRADLDAGIDAGQQAVAASPGDAAYLSNLSVALIVRFKQAGGWADLDAAINAGQQAVAATAAGHPDRAAMLSTLGFALNTRFERTGDQADLDAAINAGQQAVAASPAGHPGRASYLTQHSGTLQARFKRTGDQADLDAAINASQQALTASATNHPDRPAMLSALGTARQARFERTGDRADLDAAINAYQRAAAADHINHLRFLSNLGLALRIRFEQTGNQADLDAAINASQQALTASATNHPDRPAMLSALGTARQARFERTGDRADLDAAINAGRQAVAVSPADYPGRAGYLTNLGLALRIRFEQTGDRTDLDAAIDAGQQAVAATPADHPDRTTYLTNLGLALRIRFERTGDGTDLDTAIDVNQQAVAAIPVNHPRRATMLSNLGLVLRIRFERTGDGTDLDTAIDATRQAVAATPTDHPGRAAMLSALGLALQTRFDRTGNRTDLDTAIDASQQAVAATPADHPSRAGYLSNLCIALRTRFQRTGNQADLDAAINAGRQAVAPGQADNPGRATLLVSLCAALTTRFERTGNQADLDAAIDAGRQAVAVEVASPRVRAMAARGWGRAAASGRRWREAAAGFAAAAELLGLVAPRSLARGDQEHLLEQFGGLGADAAACCVHAGLTDRAVELFEQGRGVLLGQALDTRTGLTALTEQHPDLAARFTVLRDDLDRADDPAASASALPTGMGGAATDGRAQAARRVMERRRTAEAFDQVIAEIRQLPKLDGFLRPPSAAELLAAAAEGPVVVVTVSRFGSHALILTGGGVLDPVPLTGLTPETVYDRVNAFLGALEDAGSPAAEQRLSDTLGWLWEVLAGPVLDRLGITGPPPDGQPWPRLWWCVSGLLSFLPVHAAGHHQTRDDAAPATVVDWVISSYTPTIRALTYARRSPSTAADDGSGRPGAGDRVIAVAMPHTPDAPDLPGAQAEVTELQQRFPSRVTVLTGPQATHDTVPRALQAGRWAHFACHAASDLSNPSASYLLLTDHEQRPLTVVDVARLRLDDADLAFLSACSTGRPGGRLADEAIHLASAFQLAGYRHVIATLWPIGDQHAVDIADGIYTTLTTKGEDDVAGAVHAAVRRMRRRWGWDAPSVWASHIHAGA